MSIHVRGQIVAEYSSERSCDGNAPGVYAHIGTDLVLFAAVLVFPPADGLITHEIDKHNADRFNAAFAPAIAKMAGDIAYQASRDPHLQSFASAARSVSQRYDCQHALEVGEI